MMSYTPSHQLSRKVANPKALTVIEHTTSTTQTISVGNRVQVGNINNWYGSFSPTIATNQITLPSGYYYYIESMVNAYMTSGHELDSYLSYQHYDETGSANIGTLATIFATYNEDNELFSRDGCARALIDCTSASKDLSDLNEKLTKCQSKGVGQAAVECQTVCASHVEKALATHKDIVCDD
jgi:hypothetical protein